MYIKFVDASRLIVSYIQPPTLCNMVSAHMSNLALRMRLNIPPHILLPQLKAQNLNILRDRPPPQTVIRVQSFTTGFYVVSGVGLPTGVAMREKKSGALSRMQKLRKRLSHSFGRLCKCYIAHSLVKRGWLVQMGGILLFFFHSLLVKSEGW